MRKNSGFSDFGREGQTRNRRLAELLLFSSKEQTKAPYFAVLFAELQQLPTIPEATIDLYPRPESMPVSMSVS